jgi:hypothetical protein
MIYDGYIDLNSSQIEVYLRERPEGTVSPYDPMQYIFDRLLSLGQNE